MANDNEQNRDDRDNIEFEEDPVLRDRVRQDIRAALEPEGITFRSRRTSIMDQIRAEAASQNGSDTGAAPVSFTERATARRERRGFIIPVWAGTLAASLVVLVIAVVAFVVLTSNNTANTTLNAGPQAVKFAQATATANRAADSLSSEGNTSGSLNSAASNQGTASNPTVAAAAGAAAPAAAPAPTPQANFAATTAAATTAAATTAAATTASLASGATTAAATTAAAATTVASGATTVAAATTAAATTAAATTAAATTAAATTAAATTAAATTAAATTAPIAQATLKAALPLPLYSGAVTFTVENGPLRTFLQNQAQSQLPDTSGRESLGLENTLIGNYNFQASKVGGTRAEDVMAFYQTEATKQGYTVSAALLQNDDKLRARWLYFTKGPDKFGILIVEVLDTQAGNSVAGPGKLVKGDTGIFFATSP